MAQLDFQKQVLGTLTEMKRSIEILRKDGDYLADYIEDAKLTKEERKQLDASIAKVMSGDTSEFVSWKEAKKELGI
ncbi:MAG: hypothetical protein AABY27_00155 [Pseudomonadota bacterium]